MASTGNEDTFIYTPPSKDGDSDQPAGLQMEGSGVPEVRFETEAEEDHTDVTEKTPLTLNGDAQNPVERVRFILENEDDIDLGHSLFCQMDVLCHFEDGSKGWKEAARWLKYEEKVDPSDRWSKPHVTTTTVHALNEVKSGLKNGVVMLDLETPTGYTEKTSDQDAQVRKIMEAITDAAAAAMAFDSNTRANFLEVLLKPHKHKHRKGAKDSTRDKAPAMETNHNEKDLLNGSTKPSTLKSKNSKKTIPRTDEEISALYHSYPGGVSPKTLSPYKPNKHLMKKIGKEVEVANILVGQVNFFRAPVIVFARLTNPVLMADFTEVSIPTRFVYLVLGPTESSSIWEYEGVGRAAASLFSDKIFCEVAYKAENTQDLIDGVNEYMDDLTVLPPSLWDPATRLEPPDTTLGQDKIKARLDSARHAAPPEKYDDTDHTDPSLQKTGRIFGGLIGDIKRRYPLMLSDYKDGLHVQCLASIIFLFFACITPIVTFGGLMGHATDGYMGTMEMLLSGAICGLIFHTCAGQPLTIVGATGPLLVFEAIIYHTCHDNNIDFLSFRFWVGTWIALMLLLMVMFDLSYLVQYITRFTEESFAVLISLIFVYEAFNKLAHVSDTHPIHTNVLREDSLYKCHCQPPGNITETTVLTVLNDHNDHHPSAAEYVFTNVTTEAPPIFTLYNWTQNVGENCITYRDRIVVEKSCISEIECLNGGWELTGDACHVNSITHAVPDVFLLCIFLFLGTFGIAYTLRILRTSPYFASIVRNTLADFAVFIAIVCCTGIDIGLGLDTPKLRVPSEFKTTRDDRDWVVNPGAVLVQKWWLILAAILPAFFACILIFLDQQISAVIVNRKEHKLVKSYGYHLDLMVLTVLIFITSLLGLPWFVAATVRSLTHVKSLLRESEQRAPGEKSQFLGVREQRLTGVCIHILIGLSVFCTSILQYIPMPVLYGVFMYMGITSLGGVQFVDRILIMLMPQKFQPDHIYLRHVKTSRIHMFTLVQIICMVIMWVLKSFKKVSIIFPLMILALCFIRKLFDFYFTQNEMYWLDHLLPDDTRRKLEDEDKDVEMTKLEAKKVSMD